MNGTAHHYQSATAVAAVAATAATAARMPVVKVDISFALEGAGGWLNLNGSGGGGGDGGGNGNCGGNSNGNGGGGCGPAAGVGGVGGVPEAPHRGAQTTTFVQRQLVSHPVLAPLLLVLKQLLVERGLHDAFTGGLSSYALTVMATALVAPYSLQAPESRPCLGALFVQFLSTFGSANFDPRRFGVVVRPAAATPLAPIDYLAPRPRAGTAAFFHPAAPVMIQDPLVPEENVGASCFGFRQVQAAFDAALAAIRFRAAATAAHGGADSGCGGGCSISGGSGNGSSGGGSSGSGGGGGSGGDSVSQAPLLRSAHHSAGVDGGGTGGGGSGAGSGRNAADRSPAPAVAGLMPTAATCQVPTATGGGSSILGAVFGAQHHHQVLQLAQQIWCPPSLPPPPASVGTGPAAAAAIEHNPQCSRHRALCHHGISAAAAATAAPAATAATATTTAHGTGACPYAAAFATDAAAAATHCDAANAARTVAPCERLWLSCCHCR